MTDYNAMIRQLFTAPARGMTAQPPKANLGGGMIEKLHNAIDPVQAMGGYGNLAAMALPPGAPRTIRGFHGTKGDWSKFDMGKSQREAYGSGMHIAADPALANMFSRQFKEGGTVMPVEMNLTNPASQAVYKKFAEKHNYDPKATSKALKDAGYDSVEYNHGNFYWAGEDGALVQSRPGQDKAYAVLQPGRVKSALTGETLFGATGTAGLGAILADALKGDDGS
jgi:hypothetical protein